MGLIVNPFADDSIFGLVPLTESVNMIPNTYGRLNNSGLFNFRGITSDTVVIEVMNNIVRLLPSQAKGGQSNQAKHGKRSGVTFKVPHIPLDDFIYPSEYSNVRAFGTTNQLETYSSVMMRHLEENHLSFEATWEFLKWGAIKGIIFDGDGTTVLCDLFDKFEITPKVINFELDNPDTDVAAKCRELTGYTEDNLLGDIMTKVHVFVSPEFMNMLIAHKNVEKFYINHAAAAQIAKEDPRKGFTFQGVTFEEFRGQVPAADGDLIKFIEPYEGHSIPIGTIKTFSGVYAPGDFMETVNTEGQPIYVSLEPLKHDKGVEIYMESNPLPYCTRPKVLVKVLAKAA